MTTFRDITGARRARHMIHAGTFHVPLASVAAPAVAVLVLYFTAGIWWGAPWLVRYSLLFGLPAVSWLVVSLGRVRGRSVSGWVGAIVERYTAGWQSYYLGRPMRRSTTRVRDRVRRVGR